MARRGSSNFTVHANMESKGFQRGVRSMGVEVRQFASSSQRDLRTLSGELGLMGGRWGGVARAATGAFSGMSAGAKTAAIGIAGVTVAVGALAAAYQSADRASKQFATIDTLRRRTAVAAGGNFQANLPGAGALGQSLATEFGIAEEQVQPALYDAFATTGGWKEAEDLVRIAARNFWLAGVDLQTTAKTFVDNAKLFDISTQEYADATAFITRISKLTPEDVGRFAPQFLGRGQSLGIGLQDQLAMFGTATSRFRPEQASTRLGEFFNALADPNHKLTKAFSTFAGKLPSAMDDLVGELSAFRASVGDDAFSALAVGSVGDIAKALTEGGVFEEMRDKMGQGIEGVFVEMSDFVMETEELRQKSLDEQIKEIWKNFGETIAPEMNDFKQTMADVVSETLPSFAAAIDALAIGMETTGDVARWGTDLYHDIAAFWRSPGDYLWGGKSLGDFGTPTQDERWMDRQLQGLQDYYADNYDRWAEYGTKESTLQNFDRDLEWLNMSEFLSRMEGQVDPRLAFSGANINYRTFARAFPEFMAEGLVAEGVSPEQFRTRTEGWDVTGEFGRVADLMQQLLDREEGMANYLAMIATRVEGWDEIVRNIEGNTGDAASSLEGGKDRATYYSPITTADFLAQGV